jgi:hypothetical protein
MVLELTKERIEQKAYPITETGCWIWMGGCSVRGYGQIESYGKKHLSHRVSYSLFKGPVEKKQVVCHRCDMVSCVNPDHLFVGTQKDNLQDMARKGRSTAGHKNPRAKLSWESVRQIRKLFSHGMKELQIASQFNVSRSAIQLIVSGKRWKEEN